jgi:hypothetical protein
MNSSTSIFAVLFLSVASAAVVGCAQDTSDADSSTAAQTSCSYSEALASYNHKVQVAQDTLKAAYAAALAKHDAGVEAAKQVRDAELASLGEGQQSDVSGNTLNAAIQEYNAKVGPDGTLVQAYNADCAAAKAQWDHDVAAARAAYDAGQC